MKHLVIGYNRISDESINIIKEKYDFVFFFKDINPYENKEFLGALNRAEGVIGMGFPAESELLDMAPNLKVVCNIGTGYNNLDLEAMKKRSIMGTNTPGILDNTTADLVFSLVLSAARRIPEMNNFVKAGLWKETLEKDTFGKDVYGKKLGIIGMGKIGSLIAKRAHCGFDMEILYYNRSRNVEAEKKYQAKYCDLESLLGDSDYICMMTPLTPQTRNMIDIEAFRLMKSDAIFVNASRGETVNEKDLIKALESGLIKGAALDVFDKEPIAEDNPLLRMNNVVTTPHMGASTIETISRMSSLATENLMDALQGKTPKNILN